MVKWIAAKDITYNDDKGRPVVRWKKGEVIDDPKIAEMLSTYAKENVVQDDKPDVSSVKKPSRAGKKKS